MEKYNEIKKIKFVNNKAGIKLNQSLKSEAFTVTTRTYAATDAITNTANALAPIGNPKRTSVMMPDKNINPYPKN